MLQCLSIAFLLIQGLFKFKKKNYILYRQRYCTLFFRFVTKYVLCSSIRCFYFFFLLIVEVKFLFFLCSDLMDSKFAKRSCFPFRLPTSNHNICKQRQFYFFCAMLVPFVSFFFILFPWLVPQVQCGMIMTIAVMLV